MTGDITNEGPSVVRTIEISGGSSRRRSNPFIWRGYLTPDYDENDKDLASSFGVNEIRTSIFTIGRNPKSSLVLTSPDVSREHARIHKIESDFYLEDLNSRHGTYINGDRVLWSRLSDGDILQFGARSRRSNIWYFDRAAVRKQSGDSIVANSTVARPEHLPTDQLVVTFWGCRGSIPTPGSHTDAYGGNTTCVEVRYGDTLFVLDAGTGIRTLSHAWTREFGETPLDINLLFSHLHWDHIQGFPFLNQAYDAANSLQIIGVERGSGTLRDMLSNQMQGQYFPIPMDAMKADISFSSLEDELEIGGVKITQIELPHPGGALAYKFQVPTGTFIFATDCELNAICPNAQQIDVSRTSGREFPEPFVEFFRGADLLVIDCQYTDELYRNRVGWGHNSVSTVIDFCQQTKVRSVALTHHDPSSSDADIQEIVESMDMALRLSMQEMAPSVFAAREEMMVAVKAAAAEAD